MSKADWEQKHFGNKAAVDINGITISEHDFVKSMKLNGWISNFIVDVQCSIWREEEEWKDKIILSQSAVVSINLSTCNVYTCFILSTFTISSIVSRMNCWV
jgi:LEA14-like dessication related protein